jgi:hypothetical protein
VRTVPRNARQQSKPCSWSTPFAPSVNHGAKRSVSHALTNERADMLGSNEAELAMRDEPNVWVKVPKCALM